jgi:hypothetical protein
LFADCPDFFVQGSSPFADANADEAFLVLLQQLLSQEPAFDIRRVNPTSTSRPASTGVSATR